MFSRQFRLSFILILYRAHIYRQGIFLTIFVPRVTDQLVYSPTVSNRTSWLIHQPAMKISKTFRSALNYRENIGKHVRPFKREKCDERYRVQRTSGIYDLVKFELNCTSHDTLSVLKKDKIFQPSVHTDVYDNRNKIKARWKCDIWDHWCVHESDVFHQTRTANVSALSW